MTEINLATTLRSVVLEIDHVGCPSQDQDPRWRALLSFFTALHLAIKNYFIVGRASVGEHLVQRM